MTYKEQLRRELYLQLHALSVPLCELRDSDTDSLLPAVDGTFIYWPDEQSMTAALLLHQLIHCLFCHPFLQIHDPFSLPAGRKSAIQNNSGQKMSDPDSSGQQQENRVQNNFIFTWDLSCDLAAWEIARRWIPELFPDELKEDFLALTFLIPSDIFYRPEALMKFMSRLPETASVHDTEELLIRLEHIQRVKPKDSHDLWPVKDPLKFLQRARASGDQGGQGNGQSAEDTKKKWEFLSRSLTGKHKPLSPEIMDPGLRKGTGSQGLNDNNRIMRLALTDTRRHNYLSLLSGLADWREEYRLNANEFHYAYYLYGCEHLNETPLIEPLEYEETKKIAELVIIIDTSASCAGGLVQAFLEETRNLMDAANLFFHPFRLHILQCDTNVRRDDLITSREDFEEYIEDLEIHGIGGTDFRPAFSYIEKLKQQGEFSHLQGILFFTDGCGLYPTDPPEERTIFIFLKDHYDDIDVPEWAETLVLNPERNLS